MRALKVVVFGACPASSISACTRSASCHWPLVLHAIMSVLYVRVTGLRPRARMSLSTCAHVAVQHVALVTMSLSTCAHVR